jgi:hypothetical protein
MAALPHKPEISVRWVGDEREPVVLIDSFAPEPEELRDVAGTLEFEPIGTYYPGLRAAATPAYFDAVGPTIFSAIHEFFGGIGSPEVLRCYYSLMTFPPGDLMLAQRIPHVDALDDNQIAVLHYLNHDFSDGTAFFRHRSTGFETVNEPRQARYDAALQADFATFGEPDPAYIGSDDKMFETTCKYRARFNRALIYRGKLLHCASMMEPERLSANPFAGRLTVASFIAFK